MATALLNQVSNEFGGDTLNRIASTIGESPGKIKTALTDLLPAMLGSLANKAQTREGAHELLDVIHRDRLDTEQYNHVSDAIKSPNAMGNLMNTGAPLLDTVFEGKTGEVTDWVASHSGINHTSSKSLMSLATPLVLGMLGRQVGGGGESGLMNLLGKPRSFLQDAPAGLAGILGIGGVAAGATGAASATAANARSTASGATASARPVMTGVEETIRQHHYGHHEAAPGGAWRKWLWLVLLLLALAILLAYFLQRRAAVNMEQPAAPAVTAPATPPVATPQVAPPEAPAPATPPAPAVPAAPAAPQAPEAAAPAAPPAPPMATAPGPAQVGGFVDQSLPDGATIHIPANGVESKLIAFIEDPNQPVSDNKWFNFDRLQFRTGSAALAPSSQEQLSNVAAILKAYPQVNMKIGGFTDNTGNPQQNIQLSKGRATSTMNQLVSMGIDPSRLTAEGFGDQFPVASNDTPEGRQRNRRIDLNVTKK